MKRLSLIMGSRNEDNVYCNERNLPSKQKQMIIMSTRGSILQVSRNMKMELVFAAI